MATRFMRELNGEFGEYWLKTAWKEIGEAMRLFTTSVDVSADGVVTWKSNGAVIMDDMAEKMEVAGCNFNRANTAKAREIECAKELKQYIAKDHEPTAEEIYEMRAAFGAGAVVENLFTGRTYKL